MSVANEVEAIVHARLRGLTGGSNRPRLISLSEGDALTWQTGPHGWAEACLRGGQVGWGGNLFRVERLRFPRSAGVGLYPAESPGLLVQVLQESSRWGTCAYCGREGYLTVDHVVPRSRGGDNTLENRVMACPPCNHLKADFLLEELPEGWWRLSRAGLRVRDSVRRQALAARGRAA
jgi:5-methylcytosine-specific restriction endonuclease McrA